MRFRQIFTQLIEDADASDTASSDIATVSYPLFVNGATRKAKRRNARKAVGQQADSAPSYIGRGVYESQVDEIDRRGFLRGMGAVGATAALPGLAKAAGAVDFKSISAEIKDIFVQHLKLSSVPKPTAIGKFKFTFDKQGKLVDKQQIESSGDQSLDAAILQSATNIPSALVNKWQSDSPRVSIAFGVGDGWWRAAVPAQGKPQQTTQQTTQPAPEIGTLLKKAKKAVIDNLIDPDSVKMKDIILYDTVSKSGEEVYLFVCKLNARNRMGGYTGYKLAGVPIFKSNGKVGEVVHDSNRSGLEGVFFNLYFGNAIKNGKIIFKDLDESVQESNLKEFAPVGRGPWGGDDSGEDPYKRPEPKHYSRSIDFFGKFEGDHFDREDMNDATGEFKGYWGKNQIAYFKFDNPKRTGSDDPGMGWYYEPADDGSTGPQIKTDDNFRAYLAQQKQQELGMIDAFLKSGQKAKPGSQIHSLMKKHGLAEGFNIGQEWMSDTELDQYVPERLQQQWRELLGYDENGNPSALWANLTGGYEPDVNDPQHRALMVKVANKWFSAKKIPNVKFFDVKDADDELEWLVQIGQQGVAESDPSGIMHAAKNYNKSFLITAELAEGGKKTFRVRAQSERVAREKFDQHYNQATILKVKEEGVAEAHTLNSDSVIYRLDREKPMTDTEVLVIGGAGRYTLQGLRDKARKEAEELAQDLKIEHGGAFRRSADNIKQLTNTLNTIVAAYNELRRIRTKGGRGSRGITDEDTNFIRECMTVVEQWHTIQGKK